MGALARTVAKMSTTLACEHGRYLRWSSRCGPELWLQVDAEDNLLGMNPHFSGKSRIRVRLTERIVRPAFSALDGAFRGWADPDEAKAESGAYPFVFDVPDYRLHEDVALGTIVAAQVVAFAHEVSVSATREAYNESHMGRMKLGAQSFIPTGLFTPQLKDIDPPESRALVTGHVLECELRTNELTGKRFWWVLIDSLGGIFDVVVDPAMLTSPPSIGGVLSTWSWMSGRILG